MSWSLSGAFWDRDLVAMRVRIRSNFLVAPRDGPKDFDREARSLEELEELDEVGIC